MGNNRYKVLIIEDDRNISNCIQILLESNDYQAIAAYRCSQGLMLFASYTPDLVILDLGLPDMDGVEFIEEVRRISKVPILVLSARTDDFDKVRALDLGANDYITKPFSTSELMARIRAALRIYHQAPHVTQDSRFTLDDMVIDYNRRKVSIDGTFVHLTQTEYNILALLSYNTGKIMTYDAIISAIWGKKDEGSVKKLQVNMTNIRKKLGCRPGDSRYVLNVLGVGYRMLDE